MSEYFPLAFYGLGATLAMMFALWLASLRLRDASIVDRFWGIAFVLQAWVWLVASGNRGWLAIVLAVMVSLWGLRLSWHIHSRNRGHGEDGRYASMREEHGERFWWYSLFSVFVLQALIAWVVAAPLLAVMANPQPENGIVWVVAGVAVWALGFFFEAVSDWQLARFKGDPSNEGQLLTSGLWSLSRHPNYFGDACLWWGYWLVAVSVPGGWQSFFGPLLMTLLIRYVSGVTLLEKEQVRKHPEYADYIRETPAFIPWPVGSGR